MENKPLEKYTVSFGLSFAVTSLLSALLVIAKQMNAPLKAWMKALTGHHWITHALLVLAVFVLLGLALAFVREGKLDGRAMTTVVVLSTVLSGLIVAGFFLLE
ncbi:MAG: hypothetical protein HY082_01865 [Gammaproteobacteria bacterium]|nr:hypothetical protein [Gammaproteobacteria bacterium]